MHVRASQSSLNGATVGQFLAVRGLLDLYGVKGVLVSQPSAPGGHTCPPLGVKNSPFWGPTFHLPLPYLSIQHSSEKNRHIGCDAEKHGESIALIHIGHLPPRLTEISGPVPARVVKTSFFGSWCSPILHKVLILRFCGQQKIYYRGRLLEGAHPVR